MLTTSVFIATPVFIPLATNSISVGNRRLLDAMPYSDAFLAATGAILIAFIAGLGLQKNRR